LKKHEANERIDALLREEQAALRRLPYDALVGMPGQTQRSVSPEGRGATLSTWRDLMPDRTVRIVTQYFRPGLLGSARIRAVGFSMRGSARRIISMRHCHEREAKRLRPYFSRDE
jgi:uncharacterized DUF497 family protein